jgi:hypothetical protein
MIYPEFFPEDRMAEKAELNVFNQLKKISDTYDVFYSRKFITDGIGKKPEYEVDFIIAIPQKAICFNKIFRTWEESVISSSFSTTAGKQSFDISQCEESIFAKTFLSLLRAPLCA